MSPDSIRMLHPAAYGKRPTAYSLGVVAERPSAVLVTAGQVPIGANGEIAGKGDFAVQVRQVFENIGIVLHEADMDFTNVMKFTTYIVNPDHIAELQKVRDEIHPSLFGESDLPASTLVVVARLAHPEFLVEIEAIAARV